MSRALGEKWIQYNFQPDFLARQKDKITNDLYPYTETPAHPTPPLLTSNPQSTSPSRPNLIGVIVRTLVDLSNAEIFQVPVGQIETET